jgi:hypothetical protein
VVSGFWPHMQPDHNLPITNQTYCHTMILGESVELGRDILKRIDVGSWTWNKSKSDCVIFGTGCIWPTVNHGPSSPIPYRAKPHEV